MGDGHRGEDMDLALDLVHRAMPELKQDIDIATTLPNRVGV